MMILNLKTDLVKYIVEECNKHSKSEKDWTDSTILECIETRAYARAMNLIKSNLFYMLNENNNLSKDEVIELAQQIPELAEYIKSRNNSYSSYKPKFSEEQLKKLNRQIKYV